MHVTRLKEPDRPALTAFLEREPLVNLFLISMLDATHLEQSAWYGALEADILRAVVQVVPNKVIATSGEDTEALAEIGAYLQGRLAPCMLVGPRAGADAFWQAFVGESPIGRVFDQRLYTLGTRPNGPLIRGFRKATLADLTTVHAHARMMEFEDMGQWPDTHDPDGYFDRIKRRIEYGQTWVIDHDGQIAFQIHVGCTNAWGAQVGGTWVPPALRGRGLATAGMRAISARLLHEVPAVILHVNERNTAACSCYERAGYAPCVALRLVILPGDAP